MPKVGRPPKPKPSQESSLEEQLLAEDRITSSELDIEDFLDEWAPGTSVVEIFELRRDGSRPHMERVAMDILKEDLYGYLREHFGPAKYMLQFKDAARRIRKCLNVDVGGQKQNLAGSIPLPQSSFMEQMVLAMIAAQKPAPPLDVAAMMAGIAAMVAALKPAPATDPAAMLTAMAATFQQLKPPSEGGVKQALDLIAAAKDLVPGGSTDDSWPGLIKEGVTAVAQVFGKQTQPANGNSAPVPRIPPGAQLAEAQPSVKTETASKNQDQILQEWLTAQLAFLKTKAKAGKDPDFWVDYVLENEEEPGNAAILEALRRGATFQHLLNFDPEISNNPVLAGWFQKFYEALHADLQADVDTPGKGGDTANPGRDEKPGSS